MDSEHNVTGGTETNPKQSESDTSTEEKTLKVKIANSTGGETHFIIKKSTKLKKLMNSYCKRQGIVRNSVRFSFDGKFIGDNETSKDIELEDGDVIDAMQEQTGGFGKF